MALNLALQQTSAGHEVLFYCLFDRGKLADKAEAAGIRVRHFDKRPGFSLRLLCSLAASLRRDRPAVVHTHNPGVHHYAASAARLVGVPVVVSTRHSAGTSTGAPYQERYFRWTLPLTDCVVFVCRATRDALVHPLRLPPEKSRVIHNGIPTALYRRQPAAS